MKPVYLEMKYFGPHEDSVIDFRQLEEAPIFLIGGDTGAGKSTIFDAMTYALFGSTTGDRNAKDLRSQFATDSQETEVTFYFEQGNQLYRIIRTPEQDIAKKRGNGTTVKKATAKLAIVDDVGGTEISSVASKPADVGTEVDSILNLTADQFKKIILLPQNDFSEFLKSKTNDKEPILKKIFGTQLFTDFSSELKVKYDDARKHSADFDTKLQFQLDSNAWSDEEKSQLSAESNEQKVVLLSSFVDTRSKTLSSLNVEKAAIDKSVSTADKSLQTAKDLVKKFNDLDKFKTEYQKDIVEKSDDIDAATAHLAELNWAKPLQDTVRDLSSKTSEFETNLADQKKYQINVDEAAKVYSAAKSASDQLSEQSDDFDKQNKRTKALSLLIPKVENIEELRGKISAGKPELEKLNTDYGGQKDSAGLLSKQIEKLQSEQVSVAELQQKRNDLTAEKETFVDTLTPLESKKNNLQQEASKVKTKVADLENELKSVTTELETDQKEYEHQIARRQDLMIAQLQKELVDGQACVVCGSTDHSHMVHKIDADETQLKIAMEEVDKSQDNYASAKKSVQTVTDNVSKAKVELETSTKDLAEASEKLNSMDLQLSSDSKLTFPEKFEMDVIKQTFDREISEVDSKLVKANQTADVIKKLETELASANEKANSINLKLTAKKSELDNNQKDLDARLGEIETTSNSEELKAENAQLEKSVSEYQAAVESASKALQQANLELSQNQTRLKDTTSLVAKQKDSIDQLKSTLKQALAADDAKTSDETELKNWINAINADGLSKLQVQISNYNRDKERLTTEIKKLETDLTDAKLPDIEKLQQTLADLNTQKDELIKKTSYATKTFEDAKESYQAVETIMKQQGSFAKKLGEITSLYNIVNGKDGNDSKLKLETYVVQNYLQRVLNYANDHFINLLSNNRYTFELADQGADKRVDHGLDINVFDNETGDSRSSNTLSGGETFIAALSIALSLSDVVQSSSNGVKIDALFVDEGFGSLDDETLDKAMVALEQVGQDRMVGVISHIDSMKKNIGQQVLIKKLGDGRSTVQLVSK